MSMKKRFRYLVLLLLPVFSFHQAAAQETNYASNIKKSLSVDGKGLTIEYDLAFPDTTQRFDIVIKIDHNGKQIQPRETDLHGDWGNRLKPGTEKIIMWDFTNDFKGNINELKVDVLAVKTRGPSAGFDFKILTNKPPFDVQFINKSKNSELYAWNFGDLKSGINNFSNQESPVHQYKSGGIYNASLTVFNNKTKISDSIMKVVKVGSSNTQEVQKYKKQKNIWLGSAIATAGIGGICLLKHNSLYNDWKEKGTADLKQKYKTYGTVGVIALVGSAVCVTEVIVQSKKLNQAKMALVTGFIPLEKGGIVALSWTF